VVSTNRLFAFSHRSVKLSHLGTAIQSLFPAKPANRILLATNTESPAFIASHYAREEKSLEGMEALSIDRPFAAG
jgi:hypothetical protein